MRAKLRGTTGAYFDVVEVDAIHVKDSIPFVRYYVDDEGTIYDEQQLEFETYSPKEITIEGWVARDKCGPTDLGLSIYTAYPRRMEGLKRWNGREAKSVLIDHRLFPSITWDSEPKRVKITITPIEEWK